MKAVILAAGMASRLRPLTETMPKCLLKVGSRCLLQRTLDALLSAGIKEIVIVVGYRAQQIKDFVHDNYAELQVSFVMNDLYQSTNNIYSLWLAKEYVAAHEFMLLDSDILFDKEILSRLTNDSAENALALNNHRLGEEEIKVIVDGERQVTEISKTCSIEEAVGESVGIEKMSSQYSKALFDELKVMMAEGLDNVFYEKAFERLIPQGFLFKIVDTTDLFSIELDTVEDFNQAKELIPDNLY